MPVLFILSLVLLECGETKERGGISNKMKYIGIEALKDSIESGSDEFIILDVRQVKDFNTNHIVGSYNADVHAANKEGDDETGIANLKATLKKVTGSEVGNDNDKYALVCYSGRSYVEKATDLMVEMGISADQIYTLEGGMKAWEVAGQEYTKLLID